MQINLDRGSKEKKQRKFEAVVVGAGPAGLTAGIYLGRAKIDTVILEKMVPGGYIATTDYMENYPGFPEGISGQKLGNLMKEHAEKFGAIIEDAEVKNIDFDSEPMLINTSKGEYRTEAIIIATGTSSKKLNVPGEDEFTGRGISLCATCDAPFFEDEDIVVVGAGNSGLQESIYLSQFASHITVVELLDHPTGEQIIIDRAREKDNIDFLFSHRVIEFTGDKKLKGVKVENIKTEEERTLEVSGAFIYIGLVPNTKFLENSLEVDKDGFIRTDEKLMTSQNGVFAAGDVRRTPLRQVATAVGDGALAANSVREYLEER